MDVKEVKPLDRWVLLEPIKDGERTLEGGLILPDGVKTEGYDMLKCKVVETGYAVNEHIVKDAICLIPKLEGLQFTIDGTDYKFVDMDRVIAIITDIK